MLFRDNNDILHGRQPKTDYSLVSNVAHFFANVHKVSLLRPKSLKTEL